VIFIAWKKFQAVRRYCEFLALALRSRATSRCQKYSDTTDVSGDNGQCDVPFKTVDVMIGTFIQTTMHFRTEKCLSDEAFTKLQKRYRNILTRGKKELPVIPSKSSCKRGKLAKSDAHNLWERLKIHEAAVLLFAKDPHVSFTNNRAKRDLRMAKVEQRVSGCFRVSEYAHAYCRISSYLQSMATTGYNPLVAIQIALAGEAHKVWGE